MTHFHGGMGSDSISADGRISQVNNFNQLFCSIEYEAGQENYQRNNRTKIDLSLNAYDNTYAQLPNSLQLGGHIFSQKVVPPTIQANYRGQEENGRNLLLLKSRVVDVSGTYENSKDLPLKPTIISNVNQFNGIIH